MSFIVILPLAACIAYLSKRKIEETLSISIFFTILVLIGTGLLATFQAGCVLITAVNVIAAGCCIYWLFCSRERMKSCLFTKGMAAYLLLGILMFIASYGRYLQAADEFTYWGKIAKFYYVNGKFGDLAGVVVRYLEISALWDYYSTKMWTHFSVGIMTFGHAMMILSFLMPVFSEFSGRGKRTWGKWLAAVVMIWMFPMLGAGVFHGYVTLYADMLLGAAMIYVLVMFLRWQEEKREFYFGCMLLGLAVVVLTKQAGMILGAILVLVIAGTTLAVQPETNRKNWLWMMTRVVFAYAAAALAANGVPALLGGGGAYTGLAASLLQHWGILAAGLVAAALWLFCFCKVGSRYILTVPVILAYVMAILLYMVKGSSLSLHENGLVLFAVLKTVMCGSASHMGYWWGMSDYTVVNLLLMLGLLGELLLYHTSGKGKLFPDLCRLGVLAAAVCTALNVLYEGESYSALTFLLTFVLVVGEVIIFCCYFRKRAERILKNGGFYRSVSFWMYYYLIIGLVMYLLFYYSGIAVAYGIPKEGWSTQNARSLWRYLFSYMGPLVFLLGYRMLRKADHEYVGNYNPFWGIMLLFLLDSNLVLGVSQLYDKPEKIDFKGIEGISFESGDVISFVNANADNEPNAMGDFSYQVYPGNCDGNLFSINWYEDDILYGTRMTPEEVSGMLEAIQCSYVYLRNIDMEKGFAEYYSPIFADENDISYDRLYRVEQGRNGLVSLVYVPRQVE